MSRWNALFLGIGAVALAILIHTVGLEAVGSGVARAGWGFALGCAVHLLAILCDAYAFKQCAGEAGAGVGYGQFARASLAGHALNQVTALNLGEVTKYSLLREHMTRDQVAAALILDNLLMFIANAAVIGTIPPLMLLVLGIRGPIAVVVLVGSTTVLLTGLLAWIVVRRGPGTWPFKLARLLRVPEQRVARARAGWERIEVLWRTVAHDRKRISLAFAMFVLSRLLDTMEYALFLYFMGYATALPLSFLIMSNSMIVGWLTPFVPAQTGTAEGSTSLFFHAIGLAPHDGIVVALLNKARRVVFVAIGVALLGGHTFWQLARSRPARTGEPAPTPEGITKP